MLLSPFILPSPPPLTLVRKSVLYVYISIAALHRNFNDTPLAYGALPGNSVLELI